jgi:tetratricopeptide (TPR) repeat protein
MFPAVRKAYDRFMEIRAKAAGGGAREINIFLSLAVPSPEEETELNEFVNNLNIGFLRRDVRFNLRISGRGKRKDDAEAAENSDLFYVLYDDEPGVNAGEDLRAALKAFRRKGSPKINAYGRQPGTALADGLLNNRYAHIDTVKLSIALQLKSLGLEYAEPEFDGTALVLDGKTLMKLDNIPAVFNSRSLAAMKEEYAGLERRCLELRERVRKDPGDEGAMTEYLSVSGKKNKAAEAMQGLQRDIIALETAFLEKASIRYISPRQQQVRGLLESGDLEGAKKLLDLDVMALEDEHFDEWLEETRKRVTAKINEYLYLADMLKTDADNPGRFALIERTYGQAVKLEEKHRISGCAAAKKYIDYLYYQKEYEKAAELAIKQISLTEAGGTGETETADFCTIVSRCRNRLHRYKEAEEMSKKAVEIRERLTEENPKYEPDLAKSLDGLARLLEINGRWEDSERIRRRTLGIYERLSRKNPAYLPDLAKGYNNMSEMYVEIQRYGETEEYCKKALDIHERLAMENPSVYDADLARSYGELAFLYNIVQRYEEAETLYKKSTAIRERLAMENPAAFEPDLAYGYMYFSKVYDKTQNVGAGGRLLEKALKLTERLAAERPEAFQEILLANLSNLAKIYAATGKYSRAEALYKRALEICGQPAAGEPTPSFTAIISYNYALLCGKTGKYTESEALHKGSLEIYESLIVEKPGYFEPDLAKGYNGLAGLYQVLGRWPDAEALYKKALEIRERLAAENPEAFGPDLAESRDALEDLYRKMGVLTI